MSKEILLICVVRSRFIHMTQEENLNWIFLAVGYQNLGIYLVNLFK